MTIDSDLHIVYPDLNQEDHELEIAPPHEVWQDIQANYDTICTILNSAHGRDLGEFSDLIPESKGSYSNIVRLVEITPTPEQRSILGTKLNIGLKMFVVEASNHKFLAIYKPLSGEYPGRKTEYQIPPQRGLYLHEYAASIIDHYGGFGIVPPTVIKQIDQEIGSLQLFVPSTFATTAKNRHDINHSSNNWRLIAVFDQLIRNADRHSDNYLVGVTDPSLIIAIDHGLSFCLTNSKDPGDAFKSIQGQTEANIITPSSSDPVWVCLNQLIQNKVTILRALPPEISGLMEISYYNIFENAQKMLDCGLITS